MTQETTQLVTPFYMAKAFSHIGQMPMKSWAIWENLSDERKYQLMELCQILADNCEDLANGLSDLDKQAFPNFADKLKEARTDFLLASTLFVRELI